MSSFFNAYINTLEVYKRKRKNLRKGRFIAMGVNVNEIKETIQINEKDLIDNRISVNDFIVDDLMLELGYNKKKDKDVKRVYNNIIDWEITVDEKRVAVKVLAINESLDNNEIAETLDICKDKRKSLVLITNGKELNIKRFNKEQNNYVNVKTIDLTETLSKEDDNLLEAISKNKFNLEYIDSLLVNTVITEEELINIINIHLDDICKSICEWLDIKDMVQCKEILNNLINNQKTIEVSDINIDNYKAQIQDLSLKLANTERLVEETEAKLADANKKIDSLSGASRHRAKALLDAIVDNKDSVRHYVAVINTELLQFPNLNKFTGRLLQKLHDIKGHEADNYIFNGDLFGLVHEAERNDMIISNRPYDIDLKANNEDEVLNKLRIMFSHFDDIIFDCKKVGTLIEEEETEDEEIINGDEIELDEDDEIIDGDEVEIDEDEETIDKDEIEIDEDEIELDEDEIELDEDEIELDEDEIELDENEIELDEDEIELDEDEIELDEDEDTNSLEFELDFDSNEIELDNTEVGIDEKIDEDSDDIDFNKLIEEADEDGLFNNEEDEESFNVEDDAELFTDEDDLFNSEEDEESFNVGSGDEAFTDEDSLFNSEEDEESFNIDNDDEVFTEEDDSDFSNLISKTDDVIEDKQIEDNFFTSEDDFDTIEGFDETLEENDIQEENREVLLAGQLLNIDSLIWTEEDVKFKNIKYLSNNEYTYNINCTNEDMSYEAILNKCIEAVLALEAYKGVTNIMQVLKSTNLANANNLIKLYTNEYKGYTKLVNTKYIILNINSIQQVAAILLDICSALNIDTSDIFLYFDTETTSEYLVTNYSYPENSIQISEYTEFKANENDEHTLAIVKGDIFSSIAISKQSLRAHKDILVKILAVKTPILQEALKTRENFYNVIKDLLYKHYQDSNKLNISNIGNVLGESYKLISDKAEDVGPNPVELNIDVATLYMADIEEWQILYALVKVYAVLFNNSSIALKVEVSKQAINFYGREFRTAEPSFSLAVKSFVDYIASSVQK